MNKIIVAGTGTGVGKTIVSAILTTMLHADYWKPVQTGADDDLDSRVMENLIDMRNHFIHPSTYTFKAPLSPHHAARLENSSIDLKAIVPPKTSRTLVIESVGGIQVPLTTKILSIDLFKSWEAKWVIVSKHYLGSINHTLLTIEALKKYNVPILGLIFNGEPNFDTETAILQISQIPLLGRLLPETMVNQKTIQRYAKQWHPQFTRINL